MPERVRDLHALGVHIVSECRHVGARVRLLGGVAVLVKCQRVLAEHCGLRRCPDDIDVAARQGDIRKLSSVLARIGFHEDAALPGPVRRTRRVYRREADRIKLDIYLDRFRMCHSFPFDGRLDLDDGSPLHRDGVLQGISGAVALTPSCYRAGPAIRIR